VKWNSDDESSSAIENGKAWISEEVLALSFKRDSSMKPSDDELGLSLELIIDSATKA
jgi:hypothetical protein